MTWDPVWEDVFFSRPWGKYPAEELIRFVAKSFFHSTDHSMVKLLELGCGPGGNCWFFAREGFQTFGIDGSPSAIAQAQERLDQECPEWQGELKVGDFLTLDFPSESMDAFIDNEAVYCNSYEESKLIYKEAARVLKRGGRFFIRTFAVGSYGYGTGDLIGHNAFICSEGPLKGCGPSRFTDQEEIQELLGIGSGLRLDSVETLSISHNNGRNTVIEFIILGTKVS